MEPKPISIGCVEGCLRELQHNRWLWWIFMAAIALFLRSAARSSTIASRHVHALSALTRTADGAKAWVGSSVIIRAYGIRNGLLDGVIRGKGSTEIGEASRRVFSRGTASATLAWAGKGAGSGGVQAGEGGIGIGARVRVLVGASMRCYYEISKARLSLLVVTTAGLGFVMGSGEVVDWVGLGWTSVGTMMAACSANAFNQIMEVANDARMKRTMRRPLPSGRMSLPHAVAFAVTIGVGGVGILAYQTNALTAELGAANLLLYTLVYTPLKQIHWINTWVGAVVGAIPPLMGWAAAAGQVDAGGWILGAALYFWQIPHFMAIAFLCRQDYAAGRFKMLSLGDLSGRRTALASLRNCIYLLPLGFLAQDFNVVASGSFGIQMFLLSAGLGASATSFYLSPSSVAARKMFRASLLYLPLAMAAMIYQRVPNPNLRSRDPLPSESSDNEAVSEYQKHLVYTDLKGIEKDMKRPWPFLPPIASLSAAPFPFLPAPEDRTFQS